MSERAKHTVHGLFFKESLLRIQLVCDHGWQWMSQVRLFTVAWWRLIYYREAWHCVDRYFSWSRTARIERVRQTNKEGEKGVDGSFFTIVTRLLWDSVIAETFSFSLITIRVQSINWLCRASALRWRLVCWYQKQKSWEGEGLFVSAFQKTEAPILKSIIVLRLIAGIKALAWTVLLFFLNNENADVRCRLNLCWGARDIKMSKLREEISTHLHSCNSSLY